MPAHRDPTRGSENDTKLAASCTKASIVPVLDRMLSQRPEQSYQAVTSRTRHKVLLREFRVG